MKDNIDKAIENQIGTNSTKLSRAVNILISDEQLRGAFCYNAFTRDVEHAQDNILLSPTAKKGTSVIDDDMACLRTYIANRYNFSIDKTNLDDALVSVAINNKRHPIKDYIEHIKWDGVPRLERWLIDVCGAGDNPYIHAVGKKMMVAAIKRVYEPGCYYAQLVILEGKQRIYKSRLVKAMGMDWYASIHLKTRDTKTIIEEMRGKWILEIEELAGFGKQDTEHMKAFVSRQTDRARLSYARRAIDFPRQSIMIATMNPDEGGNKYLVDHTGNVRYWPVRCRDGKIDIELFEDIRDQLYAEAFVLYQSNESLWLEKEEEEQIASDEQEDRMTDDPWNDIVIPWLEKKEKDMLSIEVTTTDIAIDCLDMQKDRITPYHSKKIGRILAKCGWERKRKTSGRREWFYVPPKTAKKEINWDE